MSISITASVRYFSPGSIGTIRAFRTTRLARHIKRFVTLTNLVSKSAGELASRWNQILPSLLNTYEKLKKLGFTYSGGKVLPPILAEKEGSGA